MVGLGCQQSADEERIMIYYSGRRRYREVHLATPTSAIIMQVFRAISPTIAAPRPKMLPIFGDR